MYLERDGDFDQLYVNFSGRVEKGVVAETVEAVSGVNLDLDRDGRLIGVEIVGAKDVIGTPASELNLSGELLGVKEAAEFAGKDRANFLRDLASREDFPTPIARFASGPCWLSSEVERYLRNRHRAAG